MQSNGSFKHAFLDPHSLFCRRCRLTSREFFTNPWNRENKKHVIQSRFLRATGAAGQCLEHDLQVLGRHAVGKRGQGKQAQAVFTSPWQRRRSWRSGNPGMQEQKQILHSSRRASARATGEIAGKRPWNRKRSTSAAFEESRRAARRSGKHARENKKHVIQSRLLRAT